MMVKIIFASVAAIIAISILVVYFWDNFFKCNHKWEQVHDTKYDNVGFRDKYPVVLVCTKCGKVKVIK